MVIGEHRGSNDGAPSSLLTLGYTGLAPHDSGVPARASSTLLQLEPLCFQQGSPWSVFTLINQLTACSGEAAAGKQCRGPSQKQVSQRRWEEGELGTCSSHCATCSHSQSCVWNRHLGSVLLLARHSNSTFLWGKVGALWVYAPKQSPKH